MLAKLIKKYCKRGWKVDLEKSGPRQYHLARVVVPKGQRGVGLGSAFMVELTRLADRQGVTLSVTPSKDFGATSVARLVKFYKSFGFIPNRGRNKDYEIMASMYRMPAKHNPKPTFTNFAEWLFPGDPVLRPNATGIPEDVDAILDEVACGTGVEKAWLKRSARMVLDGVSGLRCLWYLHGAEGEVSNNSAQWASEFVTELEVLRQRRSRVLRKSKGKPGYLVEVAAALPYLAEGTVVEKARYFNESTDGAYEIKRTIKLGKWLRKQGASKELLHAFETRGMAKWLWKISTHPFDVLTMSYKRSWVSCMRPGGAAELGPLTDMAAGSAIMFFYRPGADVACGRLILRPAITQGVGYPRIVHGGTVYGSGPDIDSKGVSRVLRETTGVNMPVRKESLCEWGTKACALTRYIYSDTDRDYCVQDEAEYTLAYEHLGETQWPPSALDIGDLHSRAGNAAQLVEARPIYMATTAAREIAELWVGAGSPASRLQDIIDAAQAARAEDIPDSNDIEAVETNLGRALTAEERYELKWDIVGAFEDDMYGEQLRLEPAYILALSAGPSSSKDYRHSTEYETMWEEGSGQTYRLLSARAVNARDKEALAVIGAHIPEDLEGALDLVQYYVAMPREFYLKGLSETDLVVFQLEIPAGEFPWRLSI